MKRLIRNISRLVTMEPASGRQGVLGVIEDAAILIEGGRIAWVGSKEDIPAEAKGADAIDARGLVVMPGIVDCHTHIVHAGFRQDEFNLRTQGKTYQEIAKAGGGIVSTVRTTREAGEDDLFKSAAFRIGESITHGVTALEIKTGYGLDYDSEIKIAKTIDTLSRTSPVQVFGTFLGAHVVPPEYKDKREEYVNLVVDRMIRDVARIDAITACDVFVEEGAYSAEEARRIAKAARAVGLGIHLHVDQFTDVGGGELAAELQALSADHLDRLSDKGIDAMAKAGVVGVVLPGASLFAGGGRFPNARRMIDRGLKVAIATDYNPGSNPSLDPWLMATIAATQMGMSCDEALLAMTRHAAAALGLTDAGKLAQGHRADLTFIDAPDEHFPIYRYGTNFVQAVMAGGEFIRGNV
jgi:imidazolonepropionase